MDVEVGLPSNDEGDGAVILFGGGPLPGVAGVLLP